MDFYNSYHLIQFNKARIRMHEYHIHNPGDKLNIVPWVQLCLDVKEVDLIPNKYEKFIDYNDREHYVFPFKMTTIRYIPNE